MEVFLQRAARKKTPIADEELVGKNNKKKRHVVDNNGKNQPKKAVVQKTLHTDQHVQ